MDRIYNQAKDKDVAAVVIYANSNKAYKDEACTKQFKAGELKDAFIKGALIVAEDGSGFIPVSYTVENDLPTLGYIVMGDSTIELATVSGIAEA